jgi:hypothetical protein
MPTPTWNSETPLQLAKVLGLVQTFPLTKSTTTVRGYGVSEEYFALRFQRNRAPKHTESCGLCGDTDRTRSVIPIVMNTLTWIQGIGG